MAKQKFKCHFFGLPVKEYEKLRDLGLRNEHVNLLKQNPRLFFQKFDSLTKEIPEEFKKELFNECWGVVSERMFEKDFHVAKVAA